MKSYFSFSRKLFLSVITLFLVFAACFIAYQYQREKEYKVELLDTKLQGYNERIHENKNSPFAGVRGACEALRITIIDLDGDVLYDTSSDSLHEAGNHLQRPEVRKALKQGRGYDVRRTSATTGMTYFYSATAYEDCIVRTALPYNVSLTDSLAADPHYLWFTAIVSLLLIFIFYKFTARLGSAISHLQAFAQRADKNEPIEPDIRTAFPHNELGEISGHIIQIYHRLRQTKEALYIEREKLITHLQTSREGLGVFTRQKKEILVNNLFTQYANLISDSNLQTTEEIFGIREFLPVTRFINSIGGGEERRMSLDIEKNGRIFAVECIIFQDLSFEISINDITRQEEQNRLKRQLTQNIAHELKTPVSSIQGYLETIVTNTDLPAEKRQAFLARCYAQSNRLSRLLRDISVLTRMDEAAQLIEMEQVDISRMVATILSEVALQLEEKRITVINSLRPAIELRGNYSLLYSIFRNLMDNAIAYAGTDIRIHIQCFREDEKFFYFSFADTGVGVPPEHLGRLFERFYRVDKGRSRKLGGTGLGLAIVKNAVILHGGTISAKANRGGGLEFVFTLGKISSSDSSSPSSPRAHS